MTPAIRYPSGPVTPHGAYNILHDRMPQVTLRAYDDSIVFNLMGGLAIPDRQTPERVELKAIKGLVPPWQKIQQKGGTQDGKTFVDALYDPIKVQIDVVCHGRDPQHCRTVQSHLIGSIDAKKTSELSWFTHQMGRWWAPVRWDREPDDPYRHSKRQAFSLALEADSAFWQSYPDVAVFAPSYEKFVDEFDVDYPDDMGPNYDVGYAGTGGGHMYVDNGQLRWLDDPDDPILTDGRTGVFRRKTFTTDTDNQVVEVTLGSFNEWSFPDQGAVVLGARMANTGDVTTCDGMFAEFGIGYARLWSRKSGVLKELRRVPVLIPPLPGEKWSFICGYEGNTRLYKLRRNFGGLLLVENISFAETGTSLSSMGAGYRSVGGAQHAGAALITQATPANFLRLNAGDNVDVTQEGFLPRINAGDQDAWDVFNCFGPGTFTFANGPGSTDLVSFGPLLAGQAVQVRTDPRKYGVRDLNSAVTSGDVGPQKDLLGQVLSFITFNQVTHILDVFQSIFGLLGGGSAAPTTVPGNFYQLLKGRFSNPIPAKSPGRPAEVFHVKVGINHGNADSKVIASLTPLRRYPF